MSELTTDEIEAHAVRIAYALTEGEAAFVKAFAAYAQACVAYEEDPYTKIAGFVYGFINATITGGTPEQQQMAQQLMRRGRA